MKRSLAALVAGIALVAGAAAILGADSRPAIAQESTPTPDAPESPGSPSDDPRRCGRALTGLVDDGTITQAQADAIQEALSAARASGRIPERGEGDRAAKLEAMRTVLAELVDAGTITQAQADAVIAARPHRGPKSSAEGASFRPSPDGASATT